MISTRSRSSSRSPSANFSRFSANLRDKSPATGRSECFPSRAVRPADTQPPSGRTGLPAPRSKDQWRRRPMVPIEARRGVMENDGQTLVISPFSGSTCNGETGVGQHGVVDRRQRRSISAFVRIPKGTTGRHRAAPPWLLGHGSALGSCRHVALSSAQDTIDRSASRRSGAMTRWSQPPPRLASPRWPSASVAGAMHIGRPNMVAPKPAW